MEYDFKYATQIFQDTLKTQYWDVDGRTNRRNFWHYASIAFAIVIAIAIIKSIIPFIGIITFFITLALIPPGIGMSVRRMHDIGQPWWMMFIPLYNIYLACQPGEIGPNSYGPEPQPSEVAIVETD